MQRTKTLSGDGEIRTLDPLLARQVLSQLSYTPMDAGLPSFQRRSLIHLCSVFISISQSLVALPFQVMGLSGLEPPTSRLSGVRSNQLSYEPILNPATTYFPGQSPTKYLRPIVS